MDTHASLQQTKEYSGRTAVSRLIRNHVTRGSNLSRIAYQLRSLTIIIDGNNGMSAVNNGVNDVFGFGQRKPAVPAKQLIQGHFIQRRFPTIEFNVWHYLTQAEWLSDGDDAPDLHHLYERLHKL